MKLEECIVDFKLTGECEVDESLLIKCFKNTKKTVILKYRDKYTLYNPKAGIKVIMIPSQALSIISILGLEESKHPIFVHSSTFRRVW